MNLHVGNIPFEIDENTLQSFFEVYGTVTKTFIVKDKISGLSKGFAFITMPNEEEAELALKNLNGKQILTLFIKVSIADKQSPV